MPGMRTDAYGLPVTTSSPTALAAYDRAARGLLGWDAHTPDLFQAATREDPGLALAHAGAAIALFLEERFDEAKAAAATARAAAAGQTERERGHVEALALLAGGQARDAEGAMRAHLAAFPRDALILQRLYFIWFWQGRFAEMLDLTSSVVDRYDGDSYVLGLHGFVLEEADRFTEARRVCEEAVGKNPADAWSVHALAHTLYEMRASDSGITVLPAAIHPCRHCGWFRNHLTWHLALMHMARGDYARAVRMSRAIFERAPSAVQGDLHDSISLLWRQDLVGRPPGARWKPFAAIARERMTKPVIHFHTLHLGMALAAGGDGEAAERQRALLRDRVARDRTGLVGGLVLPLLEGLHAFAAGDYRRAVAAIEPVRGDVIKLGGSRAQRDVFHDTLLEACFRAGDAERAERLLAERLARRPDHWWATRRGRGALPAAS